jgi:dTDP-4-dehydrorhamnose reductase
LVPILQSNATGLLHLTNQGSCSWHEFARAILDFVGLAAKIDPVEAVNFSTRARRPRDSSLESERLEKLLGHRTRSWQDALKAYLIEKTHIPSARSEGRPIAQN